LPQGVIGHMESSQHAVAYRRDNVTRAVLKGKGTGEIFTGGPLWRISWRHRL